MKVWKASNSLIRIWIQYKMLWNVFFQSRHSERGAKLAKSSCNKSLIQPKHLDSRRVNNEPGDRNRGRYLDGVKTLCDLKTACFRLDLKHIYLLVCTPSGLKVPRSSWELRNSSSRPWFPAPHHTVPLNCHFCGSLRASLWFNVTADAREWLYMCRVQVVLHPTAVGGDAFVHSFVLKYWWNKDR